MGEGHVNTEAEIGRMWPRAEGLLQPPDAGRDQEGISPRVYGGGGPADTLSLNFWKEETEAVPWATGQGHPVGRWD